jgi:hypothetical protein
VDGPDDEGSHPVDGEGERRDGEQERTGETEGEPDGVGFGPGDQGRVGGSADPAQAEPRHGGETCHQEADEGPEHGVSLPARSVA